MKDILLVTATALGLVSFGGNLSSRWVFVDDVLTDDAKLARVTNAVELAAANGANGILLGCGLDTWKSHPRPWRDRFFKVKDLCAARGLEIIPDIWSAGHGTFINTGIDRMEGVAVGYMYTTWRHAYGDLPAWMKMMGETH